MFRLSVKQDYPDLCGLWLEAFGEGEESAKFVFEGFSGYQHIYVLEEERAVVCMACAVPCSLQGKEGIYLYGVSPKKSHRGKGLCRHYWNMLNKRKNERALSSAC